MAGGGLRRREADGLQALTGTLGRPAQSGGKHRSRFQVLVRSATTGEFYGHEVPSGGAYFSLGPQEPPRPDYGLSLAGRQKSISLVFR
jgi:hypothetical protein